MKPMKKFKLLSPDMNKFEELTAISYNVRLYSKAYEKAMTVYHKTGIKKDLKYWENRLDLWIEKNAEEIK